MIGTLVDATIDPPVPVAGATIQFSIGTSCSGVTNAAGVASCSVTPASPGTFTLTGSYAGNGSFAASSATRQFSVLAAVASVSALPVGLDFGNQVAGSPGASHSTVLTNGGTVPFDFSSIVVGGPQAADFTLASGPNACVAGGTLAPGASCTLYASFTAGGTGARNATLTITDAGTGNAVPLVLGGVGIPLGAANVTPLPVSLAFGAQTLGTTSASRTVVLTNGGGAAFTVSTLSILGSQPGDFALGSGANACAQGSVLAAGVGTCTLYVTFTPLASGTRSASVTLADTGAGLTVAVPVGGAGAAIPPPRRRRPLPAR